MDKIWRTEGANSKKKFSYGNFMTLFSTIGNKQTGSSLVNLQVNKYLQCDLKSSKYTSKQQCARILFEVRLYLM